MTPSLSSLLPKLIRNHHASTTHGVEIANANVFEDVQKSLDSKELAILMSLNSRYPDWTVTMTPSSTGLIPFANAGEATATLDTESQKNLSWLKYEPPKNAIGDQGRFREQLEFGRYDYLWKKKSFIVYHLRSQRNYDSTMDTYFILHPREGDEIANGRSVTIKNLITAASDHSNDLHEGDVLVFDDDEWEKDTKFWKSIQQSRWDNVILDKGLKDSLIRDVEGFFDNRENYRQLEIP